MQAFTIPVAFLVEGVDEDDAAQHLTQILADAHLTQDHRATHYKLHPPELEGVPIDPWSPRCRIVTFSASALSRFVELRQAKLRTAEDTDWPRIVIVVDELALLLLEMAGASCILPPGHGGGHRAYE